MVAIANHRGDDKSADEKEPGLPPHSPHLVSLRYCPGPGKAWVGGWVGGCGWVGGASDVIRVIE